MSRTEAAQVLAILKAAYPNHYKGMSAEEAQGTISVWASQFSNISAEIVLMALNKAIGTNKFPPTIAEVKEKLVSVHWEVYEVLCGEKKLTAEQSDIYMRVYRETQGYKDSGVMEPSVSEMLSGGTLLLSSKEAK